MSVAKLLLSGLLVASGLILGAFTLHARFAPEWEVRASPARPYGKPPPVDVRQEADRVASDVPDNWAPRLIKADPKPDRPSGAANAEAAKAKKKLAEKRQVDKRQQEKAEEGGDQTVLSWLASWLNN